MFVKRYIVSFGIPRRATINFIMGSYLDDNDIITWETTSQYPGLRALRAIKHIALIPCIAINLNFRVFSLGTDDLFLHQNTFKEIAFFLCAR